MLGSLITMILGMTVFLSVGTPCVPPKAGQGVDGDLRLSIKLAGRARLRRPVRPGPAVRNPVEHSELDEPPSKVDDLEERRVELVAAVDWRDPPFPPRK
jgi:hypothetical protein